MSTKTRGVGQRGPTRRQFVPTAEWLRAKYVDEGLSAKEICALTGYSKPGLRTLLEKYGIERKGKSLPKLEISRDELYDLHVVQGLTAVQIAGRLGCHHATVSRLIRRYHLDPGRPLVNVPAAPPLTRDELWKLYWVDQLSTRAIGERYGGVHPTTVSRWCKQLGVPRRRWNGGAVVPYPRARTSTAPDKRGGLEFGPSERARIFARDGHRCRMPGCGRAEQLEAHHVVPIEHGGTNEITNGLTLCRACHVAIRGREFEFVLLFLDLALNP